MILGAPFRRPAGVGFMTEGGAVLSHGARFVGVDGEEIGKRCQLGLGCHGAKALDGARHATRERHAKVAAGPIGPPRRSRDCRLQVRHPGISYFAVAPPERLRGWRRSEAAVLTGGRSRGRLPILTHRKRWDCGDCRCARLDQQPGRPAQLQTSGLVQAVPSAATVARGRGHLDRPPRRSTSSVPRSFRPNAAGPRRAG